jgi:hypothetical protein
MAVSKVKGKLCFELIRNKPASPKKQAREAPLVSKPSNEPVEDEEEDDEDIVFSRKSRRSSDRGSFSMPPPSPSGEYERRMSQGSNTLVPPSMEAEMAWNSIPSSMTGTSRTTRALLNTPPPMPTFGTSNGFNDVAMSANDFYGNAFSQRPPLSRSSQPEPIQQQENPLLSALGVGSKALAPPPGFGNTMSTGFAGGFFSDMQPTMAVPSNSTPFHGNPLTWLSNSAAAVETKKNEFSLPFALEK